MSIPEIVAEFFRWLVTGLVIWVAVDYALTKATHWLDRRDERKRGDQ